ncbi:methyl-accepting chemotaxis protein [Dactylosporangium sp. NPDC049742]|uniref:methyl-accepting chemotaxis protein n=1 Tax=Dactylosporangium sp. NPDC049742 TaxID=3154737 RepID=UPI003412A666
MRSVTARADAAATHVRDVTAENHRTMLIGVAVALGLAVAFAVLLAGVITTSVKRPADLMVAGLRRLAARDLTVVLAEDGHDEATDMSREFNAAVAGIRTAVLQVAERAEALTGAGEQLTDLSARLDGQASTTSDQTVHAAHAADGISGHVAGLASAAEQMQAAIDEIARSTSEAATVAAGAVTEAVATSGTIAQLTEAGTEIGALVKTITGIAAQTNLLALNATIEAARNVADLAGGSQQIAHTMTAVAANASATTTEAASAQRSAASLATLAGELRDIAASFRR